MNSDYGKLDRGADAAIVRFERRLAASTDDVWRLLSTGDGIEQWLAPAKVDLRHGGVVDLDFGEDGLAGGAIIELRVGEVLEYQWQFPGEPDSVVRFELSPTHEGTKLILEHRRLPLEQTSGYGAGWHAHLDHLEALAAGTEPGDWVDRYTELLTSYAEM